MKRRPYDLSKLMQGGASARVLDLCGVHKRFPDLAHTSRPLFRHARLNRAFLIKHNLRRHERRLVMTSRSVVTKLVLPIDPLEPSSGAFWTFVESADLEAWLERVLGRDRRIYAMEFKDDVETLDRLRQAPSFDPFLMTMLFGPHDVDSRFFAMSSDDACEFRNFARRSMAEISRVALGGSAGGRRSGRLAVVLLDEDEFRAREDLRQSLHLDDAEFEHGVFGWKGLLYYLWRSHALAVDLSEFLRQLADLEARDALSRSKALTTTIQCVRKGVAHRWRELCGARDTYERSVSAFLHGGDPSALSNLIMRAPGLFAQLSDDVGVLTHMTSYWRYWSQQSEMGVVSYDMAVDLLPDLAGDLAVEKADGQTKAA